MLQADMLALLDQAARAAGAAALAYFREGQRTSAEVSYKAGNSPVSAADIAANETLERILRPALPSHGWISEETLDDEARLLADSVIIVDPIDGTRAFIAGDPYWSVAVAVVKGGEPVAGVIHAPALGVTYTAAEGMGAHCNGNPIRSSQRTHLRDARAAGPRPLLDRLQAATAEPFRRGPKTPSLALRLAQAGDGAFDLALASEGAHDWDIAAADILLREAGGVLLDATASRLRYNGRDLRRGVLAAGSPALTHGTLPLLGLRS